MPNDISAAPDVLARICADTLADVARSKAERGLERLRADIAARADAPRGFGRALMRAVAAERYGLVAEIKKASPSGGVIRPDFDPPVLARGLPRRRRHLPVGADRGALFPGQSRTT